MARLPFILLLMTLGSLCLLSHAHGHGHGHGHDHSADEGPLSGLPECSQICAHSAAIGAECHSTDTPCLCTSVEFVTGTMQCASKVCTAVDLKKSVGVLKEMCEDVEKAVKSRSSSTRKEPNASQSESITEPASIEATGSATAPVIEREAKDEYEGPMHEEL